jgi:hypothetical protein
VRLAVLSRYLSQSRVKASSKKNGLTTNVCLAVLSRSLAQSMAEAHAAMEMIESKDSVGGEKLKTDMRAWLC